jgi:RHS repeat-associated protein
MWDFENRIVQAVVPDADTVTLKYDPFGRRIQKSGPATTTNYLYDGNNPLEEVDNSGNLLSRYNQTTRIDEELSEVRAGTTSYYQADGPGSVTSLSNASGVLANTYTYNSFGNLNASSGTLTNPFRFTGREFDSETGLYFYRARYVDSSTGRFISEDPLGFKGGVNFYVFVLNNPVNLRDPLGLKACENCTNAAPLPANSPKCDSYGSETYFGTSLKCFCKCAGDSAWSEQVRGCLACEHDRGTNPFVAHQRCYRAAGLRAHRGALSASVTKNVWLSPSGQVFRT